MVELVNGLNVRKHLRYHFLWEHVMGTVFLVDSKMKDLLKKEKNNNVRNDNGNLNKHVYVHVAMWISVWPIINGQVHNLIQ
jgi:hypothetical protein